MKIDDRTLQIITNETITSVNNMEIVTPSIYKSIFSTNADNHHIDLSDEEEMTKNLFNEKIEHALNMQNIISNSTTKLDNNTNKAITAIQEKNEDTLAEVLAETKLLKDEIEKLKASIYKDELTSLFNRKWMNDKYLLKGSNEFIKSGTLAIIDLNYFKAINDSFGHIVGDKVLIFIASKLKNTSQEVVRYGGDEFIVLFSSDINQKEAIKKLNHLRETIISKKLKAQTNSFKVSFAFGVAEFKEGEHLTDIIEKADKFMYDDKIKIKQKIKGI